MKRGRFIAMMLGFFVLFVAVGTLLIVLTWSWVVPDVFSGAVQQNILPTSLTFGQAFKLAVLLAILGLTNRAARSSN